MPQGKPPEVRRPRDLSGYLETITRAVFQGGISWRVVDAKWDGIRAAFHDFEPERVAAMKPDEIDAVAADPSVIRNRRKLEATVDNAQTLLELDSEHGGFRNYLRSHGDFDATVKDLKRQFRFLGDTGAYYFLHVVGEEVPSHDEWERGRRPRRGRAG